jgi:hypothetical protein
MNPRLPILLVLFAIAALPLHTQPRPYLYETAVESEPVRIGELEFTTLTTSLWYQGPVSIQLLVANTGEKEVLFPTMDTTRIEVNDDQGQPVHETGGRDATCFTAPVKIPAHGRYVLSGNSRLRDPDSSAITGWKTPSQAGDWCFEYLDRTGGIALYGPLKEGKSYTVKFVIDATSIHGINSGSPPFPEWRGKCETKPVTIRIFEPLTSSTLPEPAWHTYWKPGWHICRFDAPSRMTNMGSQIVVSYILDPSTQSWRETLRFPESPDYLDFGHSGDEVHHGETLAIKKPVTIAFTNFKGGPVEVAFTKAPATHEVRKHPPLVKKP